MLEPMADAIGDILVGRQSEEPEEIRIIKKFICDMFQVEPKVSLMTDQIIIGVRGASLAGALRPHLFELQALCRTQKRLVIRIQ